MNLFVKVGSALLVVLTVALAVSGWISVQKEREVLNNLLQKHGQSFSNTIAVACIEALLSEDYPILDTFLETTGRERDDILSIQVLQHGKVVSRYAANDENRVDRVLFNSDVLFTLEADQAEIKLGEIQLELSNRQNRQIVADRIQELIINTVTIFILLSATLMLVFRKMVIDKIQHLNDHSKRVGAGNLDLKIDLRTRDELGHLANTFNDMVATIKTSQKDLQNLANNLRESEEKFRSISASAKDAIVMVNDVGEIIYWNEAAEKIFMYSQREILGQDVFCIVAPLHTFESYKSVLNTFKETGRAVLIGKTLENTAVRKDGVEIPIELSTSAAKIKGKWTAIAIIRDISSRKQAEEELKHYHEHLEALVKDRTTEIELMHGQLVMQEKMASIGQLAAGIAHELNNPINFVRTNFATLAENFTDLAEVLNDYHKFVEEYEAQNNSLSKLTAVRDKETTLQIDYILKDIPALFEESERGFGRIAQIVQSMRNFSHADHNGEYNYFNINKGIEDTLVITKNVYNHHAEVKTDLVALPEIRCLPDQLNQVFLNLIVNSAQAIEAEHRKNKGVIAIRTWREEQHVCCKIADDGPGIPQEIRSRIFEPFFTTKEPGQGTGLGLSISYDIIVHKHKGKLSVDCPESGGTVFTLRIPMNHQPTQNSQKGSSQSRKE